MHNEIYTDGKIQREYNFDYLKRRPMVNEDVLCEYNFACYEKTYGWKNFTMDNTCWNKTLEIFDLSNKYF